MNFTLPFLRYIFYRIKLNIKLKGIYDRMHSSTRSKKVVGNIYITYIAYTISLGVDNAISEQNKSYALQFVFSSMCVCVFLCVKYDFRR